MITYRIEQIGRKFQPIETWHDGSEYLVGGPLTRAAAQSWVESNLRMLGQDEADPTDE
jgi:hypothetical protein